MSTVINTPFVNIAAYKFVALDELSNWRTTLRQLCQRFGLRGTILISREGINLFLAGTPDEVERFVEQIRQFEPFADLQPKYSPSDHQPFNRLLVRLKKEIISMGVASIKPAEFTSPKLPAAELRAWLDEGRDVILLDTRNDYEIEVGTFDHAVPIGIDHFRQFPDAIKKLPDDWKHKPLVMFCTGGIRCEKAGPLMQEAGFEQVFQLDGGILKYFEECGGAHYHGDCFVFDKRVAVNPQLEETDYAVCYACQAVLTRADQQRPEYKPPYSCLHCHQTPEQKMAGKIARRHERIAQLTNPLPGSQPYDNIRPLNVPAALDRHAALEVFTARHSHLPAEYWEAEFTAGRIQTNGQPLAPDQSVRGGWRLEHHLPGVIEPDVNARIEIIFEDRDLVVVNKPAPLPMHPCGRFNRNTLTYILNGVYRPEILRPLHRLDANTTGVVMLGRRREVARKYQPLFEQNRVEKMYLALVHGVPRDEQFVCELPIGRTASRSGGRQADRESGLASHTEFRVICVNPDETTLLEVRPLTGRTNQIRLHLAHLGHPIIGDPVYRHGATESSESDNSDDPAQTLDVAAPPMCLHAWKLSLPVNGNKNQELNFEAPTPTWAGMNP